MLDGAIAVSLTTVGTFTITYGSKAIVSSVKGLYDDVNSLIKFSKNKGFIGENAPKITIKTIW